MKKFLKKVSPFFVFTYLILAFSGVIWALTYLDTDGTLVQSKWLAFEYEDSDGNTHFQNKSDIKYEKDADGESRFSGLGGLVGSYDKDSESYQITVPTFGYIGTAESGRATGVLTSQPDGVEREYYAFDIEGDGEADKYKDYTDEDLKDKEGILNPLDPNNELKEDYRVAAEVWDVVVPIKAKLLILPIGGEIKVISPILKVYNMGAKPADVYIKEFKTLVEANNGVGNNTKDVVLVDKSKIGADNIDLDDELYLSITSPANFDNHFHEALEDEVSLHKVWGNNKEGDIQLGVLPEYTEGAKLECGQFHFLGKADMAFLEKHDVIPDDGKIHDVYDEFEKTQHYELKYKFRKPKPAN